MTSAKIKTAIANRKTYSTEGKRSRLWEMCQRRSLPFIREDERMDAKWGFHGLVTLVTPELADLWAKTIDNWRRAMDAAEEPAADEAKVYADVDACVASCLRGLAAMDSQATQNHPNGVQPPESFEWHKNGQHFVVVADSLAAHFGKPGVRMVTMQEVAAALAYHDQLVTKEAEIREHFPDAKITGVKPKDVPEDLIEF